MSDPSGIYKDWDNPSFDPMLLCEVRRGDRTVIHPTATIGSTPFSYDLTKDPYQRKVASAYVWIGDDVEIMHHANVDRGIERDTVIDSGTKIDRHVHVAHDAMIGKRCILVAGTIVGGYAVLEDEVYCGIGVMIKPRVRIGRGAKIGMGAVILHDVPPGCIIVGNPGRVLKLRFPTPWYAEWCGPADDLRRDPAAHMPNIKWNGSEWGW